MQISARNGDYITPTIVGTGEHDYDRDLSYTRNLFRLFSPETSVFGKSNKELFPHPGFRLVGTALHRRRPHAAAAVVAARREDHHIRIQPRRRRAPSSPNCSSRSISNPLWKPTRSLRKVTHAIRISLPSPRPSAV